MKHTGNGIPVMSFALAVERNFKNAQGERETDFINCVAWRGTAETLAKFAAKGSLIGITGSIQTRNYQNNEGQTIYMTEVLVDNFQMLEPKAVTEDRKTQQSDRPNANHLNNNYENTNYANENPFESSNVTAIDEDDLPF